MKLRFLGLRVGVFLLLVVSTSIAKLPPLPSWNAEDKERIKRGEVVVGVALLSEHFSVEEQTAAIEVIIEAAEAKPSLEGVNEAFNESELTPRYIKRYFEKRPESYLVDPQQFLSMREREDVEYALRLHMEVSDIPIYVYIFGAEQHVPQAYSPQQMFDKVFGEQSTPLVMVYYYMGAPERAKFVLAGGGSAELPPWQVRELLVNAGFKARERSQVFDQLEVYVGQLSMRLFWIEELLDVSASSTENGEVALSQAAAQQTQELPSFLDTFGRQVHRSMLMLFVVLGVLIVLLTTLILYRVFRRYKFPEKPTPQRLGGKVGARSGGVMSYRNAYRSPGEQRKQFQNDFF